MGENYVISEKEVKSALIGYVSNGCFLRSAPIEKFLFHKIEMKNGYLYTLQTFSEERETQWDFVPYYGEMIDDAENGEIPGAWEMVCKPDSFEDSKQILHVPHSQKVKICHTCARIGHVTCSRCEGFGGSYEDSNIRANIRVRTSLSSEKWDTCSSCSGSGYVSCDSCSGQGQVKWYLVLIVEWKNNVKNCVINETKKLPNQLVKKAGGDIVFNESQPKVVPLNDFGDVYVKESSIGLINYHQKRFESETCRILEQKQQVKLVRVAIVEYEYKKKTGNFYVYGNEHDVYFPKYPGNPSFCCDIYEYFRKLKNSNSKIS